MELSCRYILFYITIKIQMFIMFDQYKTNKIKFFKFTKITNGPKDFLWCCQSI